jgi:hypothetical protein
MKMFAPNVMVVGDRIFEIDDGTGKPNPPAAAARYENEVMAMGRKIAATPFGARWLDIAGNNAEPIIIVPTSATNEAVAQTFANIPERPNRSGDALAAGFSPEATGRGTPVRVKFNTGALVGGLMGASAEVLLMHELTHAYRSASGRFSPALMTTLVAPNRPTNDVAKRFPNWEEWLSVVVENVYAAESGKSLLRGNWDILFPDTLTSPAYYKFWDIPGAPSKTDSETFAENYAPAILRMMQLEPRLYQAIKASSAWFNPVRDYERQIFASRT